MYRRSFFLFVLIVAALTTRALKRPHAVETAAADRMRADAIRQMKAMPIAFETNVGQTSGAASFVARGQGYAVWATADGPIIRLRRTHASSGAVVRMRVVGGAPAGHPSPESVLPGRANYFIGNEPAQWKTGVTRYGALRYAGVYPGIDLVLHGSQESLEYDFDVAPHVDPSRVALRFEGAKAVRLAQDGGLTLSLDDGEIGFRAPVAYQERGGAKEIVDAKYELDENDIVHFVVGPHDPARPLTIDPVLTYSTYLGGTAGQIAGLGNDKAFALAVDAYGYAYLAGLTSAIDFPIAGVPYDSSCSGCTNSGGDAWVAKINPTQSGAASLVFATYLGAGGTGSGTGSSVAYGVAVDGSGNVYLTGNTTGFDNPVTPANESFPTTASAFQSNNGGGLDGFLTKLNPTGSALLYSTYLGGNNTDEGSAVRVDDAGHAYVAGWAASTNFPELFNGFKISKPAVGFDGFVVKVDTNLSGPASLSYGTLVGGGGDDRVGAMAIDTLGRVYLTGYTQSYGATPFPILNGFQAVSPGGQHGFMTVVDPSQSGANSLVYSTLIVGSNTSTDGSAQNEGGVAVDAAGIVYVTGTTYGGTFPTTPGAFKSNVEQSDAYVLKIDPSQAGASSLLASTLLGGAFQEAPTGLVIDQDNNPVIVGSTGSSNLGVAACSAAKPGSTDGFVVVMDPSLGSVKFSTLLGGNGGDFIYGVGIGPASQIYVDGYTESANFPTTADSPSTTAAFDATQNGQDAFLSVIAPPFGSTCAAPVAAAQSATTPEDTPKSITLSATDADGNKAAPDTLTFTVATLPLHGTLDVLAGVMTHGSGSAYTAPVTYTPAANYNGADSFQFRVSDGWFTSSVVTVAITVTAVNDAPTADPQSVTTPEEAPKSITLTGSDPENQSLTFTITVNPTHGVLSGSGSARTYTPNLNYFGPDQFAFTVTDSGGAVSAPAIVSIGVTNVNDAPLTTSDSATTSEDVPVTVNVLANDSDPDGDPLNVTSVVCNNGAGANVNADQTIMITPPANFNGAIVCAYTVNDGHGGATTGQLTVSVTAVNDNPIAAPDFASTDDNTLIVVAVLANDADVDGDALQLGPIVTCQQGTATVNLDQTVTYKPLTGFGGADQCTYSVSDPFGGTASGLLTVSVTAVNDPPVVTKPGDLLTLEGGSVSLQIVASDPDGDALTFVVNGLPNGLTIDANGLISGAPKAGSAGSYDVSVTANDGHGGETTVSFKWTVTVPIGVNQPPVCTAAQPSLSVLWPPDRRLIPISILDVVDPDGGQPTLTVTRILQDEPTNTFGDGSTWIDGFGVGTSTPQIRAERTGTPKVPGDGRIYDIFFTATDSFGATCSGFVQVSVPHDQNGGPSIDSGVRYDSTVAGGQPIGKP